MMIDTLDLQDQQERGDRYISKNRKRRNALLFWIGILLLIGFSIEFFTPRHKTGAIYIYDGENLSLIRSNIAASQLEVADDGTVWLIDASQDSLIHYDGQSWREYSQEDTGTSEDEIEYLDVYGNNVWVLVESDVAHFDGETWTDYNHVLPSTDSAAIAVSESTVVVAGENGNIAWLVEDSWKRAHISSFLYETEWDGHPISLMTSGDGQRVFLSANGLLEFDGSDWNIVLDYDANARLIGMDDDQILLDYHGRLLSTDSSGSWYFLEESETGIQEWSTVRRALNYGNEIYFAVEDTVYVAGDSGWSQTDIQVESYQAVTDIAISHDNQLIIATASRDYIGEGSVTSILTSILRLVSPIVVIILSFAVYLLFMQRASKDAQMRAAVIRKRLPDLFPDMVEYNPIHSDVVKSTRNFGGCLNIIIFVALVTGIIILQLPPLYAVLLMVIWGFLSSSLKLIIRLFSSENDEQSRAYLRRNIVLVFIVVAVALPIWLIQTMLLSLMPQWEDILLLYPMPTMTIVVISGMLLYLAIMYAIVAVPRWYVYKPMFAGDYETALRRANQVRKMFPNYSQFMFTQGYVLLDIGRAEESEAIWKRAITESQNSGAMYVAVLLINLAGAVASQGRVDEALTYLETAAKIYPESDMPYRELVQHYIHHDANPERMMELANLMRHYERKPRFNINLQKLGWLQNQYTYALALAKNGKHDEAQNMIQVVLENINEKYLSSAAYAYLYTGYAYEAMGDKEQARLYYQKARDLHQSNATGQIAKIALEQIRVSGA